MLSSASSKLLLKADLLADFCTLENGKYQLREKFQKKRTSVVTFNPGTTELAMYEKNYLKITRPES